MREGDSRGLAIHRLAVYSGLLEGVSMIEIAPAQIEQYRTDGFLIFERFLSPGEVARARERFEPIFRGEFETALYPEEYWPLPETRSRKSNRRPCYRRALLAP
jgi:hypothetical protein